MHMRAPLGTRIEVSGRIATLVSKSIEELLPGQVENIVSNCGLPVGPHNLAFIPTPTIGSQDCDLTILLNDEKSPVWDYRRVLRKGLTERYPGTEFTFQPSDLTAKILNFGAPAPIDVQINGPDIYPNYEFARKLVGKFREIPGAADVVIQQTMRTPTLMVEGNRTFGLGVNTTLKDMADSLLMTTAGSQQIDQIYWLDPSTGMSYLINVYTPQSQINSINSLLTVPINASNNGSERECGATPRQCGRHFGGGNAGRDHAREYHAANRYLCLSRRARPRRRAGGCQEGRQEHGAREAAQRRARNPWPGLAHVRSLCRADLRAARRDRSRLSADCRQLPVLARSLHHHYGLAGRAGRHRLVVVSDPYASVGARADGRHHDHGHRDRQFDPRRLLCARAAPRARRCAAWPRSRPERPASARYS